MECDWFVLVGEDGICLVWTMLCYVPNSYEQLFLVKPKNFEHYQRPRKSHTLEAAGSFSFWILILQNSCFAAYLHDLGTKSRFNFQILILQKKR